ncbi:hypothetical protein DL764_005816 [Monosporascus ibericus]|uniref:Uncharacterized protein n=1 Tax=Monosporascus ibericus TaxID=155417 RepID=A0A4Q4TAZ3_9PEZI|nr:hypothetical protein DL764_005816 [Monosporascus ibericus]
MGTCGRRLLNAELHEDPPARSVRRRRGEQADFVAAARYDQQPAAERLLQLQPQPCLVLSTRQLAGCSELRYRHRSCDPFTVAAISILRTTRDCWVQLPELPQGECGEGLPGAEQLPEAGLEFR